MASVSSQSPSAVVLFIGIDVGIASMLTAFMIDGSGWRGGWRSRVFSLRQIITFSVMATSVPVISWIHRGYGFGLLSIAMACAASLIFLGVPFLPSASPVPRGRLA